MPVYNAAPYLDASIGSILAQTLTDFELVVLDDGSTDGSAEILGSWAARDPRVRVERVERRLGLVGSSNHVVRASRAPIVARMDADDVSHSERLARQAAVLDANPDAVLVGTLFEGIDRHGRIVRSRDRWRLLRRSPFAPFPHGSVMFRRDAFEAIAGYDEDAVYWEDFDLFRRLSRQGRILVLPEALYRYRFHQTGSRVASDRDDVERAAIRMRHAVGAGGRAHGRLRSFGAEDPAALYSVAASRLWAGDPPELLSRLRLRSLVPPTLITIGIFGVAAAAAISPGATRFALGCVIAARDRVAGLFLGREPLEWRFAS